VQNHLAGRGCPVRSASQRVAVSLALLLLAAPAARAGFVATYTGAGPSMNLSVNYNNGAQVLNGTVVTGQYNWASADPNRPGWLGPTFWTYCIELTDTFASPVTFAPDLLENAPQQGLGAGTGPGNPNGAMGAGKADRLREFWAENHSASFTNLQGAAFQLGIWEILFDNGPAPTTFLAGHLDYLGTGQLKLNAGANEAAARQEANRMLSTLDGLGPREYGLTALVAVSDGGEQDQLTLTPVPAPPGLVLAGIGVAGLLGARWRRKAA
jgi:hypothetical protein